MKRLLTILTVAAAIAYAGGISGQVVDAATGAPIADAQVVAKSANGDAGRAQTNERGVYLVDDLDPGDYNVGATARGYADARYPQQVPVRANKVTENINLRLAKERPELGAIAGRITDRRTGEPVKDAVILATDGRGRLETRSDGRGNYLLRGLKPGDYAVTAGARGYMKETYPRRVPVTADSVTGDIDFALAPGGGGGSGTISGTVYEKRTNEPIAGATVTAGRSGNSATTGRDGTYTITGLADGSYKVRVIKTGYRGASYPDPVVIRNGGAVRGIDFYLVPTSNRALD
jgi:uncharacterized surface anchored protein